MATGDSSASSDSLDDSETGQPAETKSISNDPSYPTVPVPPQLPEKVGRYIIRSKLGTGGFADVYLAHDEQLGRNVALKMPRLDKLKTKADIEQFVQEARTSAKLQHPGIVSVHDVGNHDDKPFMVLEYIRGRSLAQLLDEEPIPISKAVRLMIRVAEAMTHAHDRGFVHRDIKPQNIMLDVDDEPHVADFGLAVKRWDLDDEMALAGTTQYMAPEQVRGESHRIDLRTDIWAMGVVLYRMLTGKMPFTGSTRKEVFEGILYRMPISPTELDSQTPKELERICMRCLCRQMSDRYPRAAELADDLREWLELAGGGSSRNSGDLGSRRRASGFIPPPDAPLIPRGLRSFERADGDFFLRLLPGPRDRDGLPSTIRFWKGRIENRDDEQTFGVGVLHGPSGCGKSSLIKAGLLPQLSRNVDVIHLEASPENTADMLLKKVNKLSREPLQAKTIDEAFRSLRCSEELRGGKKLLIVIDQFEQWLGTWHTGDEDPLVAALRQCDGGNLQAILMVRDDFWPILSRLMKSIEVAIVEGINGMLVDTFDHEHARRVMCELGQSYNRFPAGNALNDEQWQFIDQSISGLTENNRLYPVRLAVFVEMVKDRPWIPETLKAMGGTKGVGVAFLEATVGSQASSSRRIHATAIRRILTVLLPAAGDINDRVLQRSELLTAAQYTNRPHDFDTVMRILDVELRLITSAQSSERAVVNDSDGSGSSLSDSESAFRGDSGYKLTHDFLVPSIREWLQRQNCASRKGRVLLLLQEQAQIWSSRPNPRFLPTLGEWISIQWQTSRQEWTEPQRLMMQAATHRIRNRVLRSAALACLLVVVAYMLYYPTIQYQSRLEAFTRVSHLKQVDLNDVPEALARLEPYRKWADPLLEKEFNDSNLELTKKLRVAIARLATKKAGASWIAEIMLTDQVAARDWPLLLDMLAPYKELTIPAWEAQLNNVEPRTKFRASVGLWMQTQNREFWETYGQEMVSTFLQQPLTESIHWVALLKSPSSNLRQTILQTWPEVSDFEAATIACQTLANLTPDNIDDLLKLLEDSSGVRYRAIVDALKAQPDRSRKLLKTHIDSLDPSRLSELHLANTYLALWELGDDSEFRKAVQLKLDASVRTQIIQNLSDQSMPLNGMMSLLTQSEVDDPCLCVAIAALTIHPLGASSAFSKDGIRQRLRLIYEQANSSETHSVAGLLLRRQGVDWDLLDESIPARSAPEGNKKWFKSPTGLTMAIVEPQAINGLAESTDVTVDYPFAVSIVEVPEQIYKRYDPKYAATAALSTVSDQTPVSGLLLLEIAGFCNWLSQQENIDESEWCYPSNKNLNVSNCAAYPDAQQRLGYRLMVSQEWELAVGANTNTMYFYGDSGSALPLYAWNPLQSGKLLHEVGQLLPNPYGLFDVYGNTREMCVTELKDSASGGSTYESRGGASLNSERTMTTSAKFPADYRSRDPYMGLRVAKTILKKTEKINHK